MSQGVRGARVMAPGFGMPLDALTAAVRGMRSVGPAYVVPLPVPVPSAQCPVPRQEVELGQA